MTSGTSSSVRSEHEHEFEAAHGLPEALPADERLLWQGAPDWRSLAREAFHVRGVTVYLALILVLRAGFAWADGSTLSEVVRAVLLLLPLFVFAVGMLLTLAWLSARTTAYTLTDKRVVMRVGIVLTLTFNLPLRRIAGAGLRQHGSAGMGDIPLQLAADEKIAFVHLWPHARPWRVARPEPMLRCIPQATEVARLLGKAWSEQTGVATSQVPGRIADAQVRPAGMGSALPA